MKKFWSLVLMVVVSSCIAAGSALAADEVKKGGDKPKASPEDIFKKLDKDMDGKLTLEEYTAMAKDDTKKEGLAKRFKAMDKESKGFLTLEQFVAFMQKHAKQEKKKEQQ
jgi:hypothetical protein